MYLKHNVSRKRKKIVSASTLSLSLSTGCLSFIKSDPQSATVLVCDSETNSNTSILDKSSYVILNRPSISPKLNFNKRYNKTNKWLQKRADTIQRNTGAHNSTDGSSYMTCIRERHAPVDTKNIRHKYRRRRQPRKELEQISTFISMDRKQIQTEDKSTYCRPVLNMYSKDYVYKFCEKQEKLQMLIQRVIEAQETDKLKVAWNKYIQDLKLKHGIKDSSEPSNDSDKQPKDYLQATLNTIYNIDDPSMNILDIECYHRNRFVSCQTSHCRNLLKDLYKQEFITDKIIELLRKNIAVNTDTSQLNLPLFFETNPYYPNSYQRNMLKLNSMNDPDSGYRNFRRKPIGVNKQQYLKSHGPQPITVPHHTISNKHSLISFTDFNDAALKRHRDQASENVEHHNNLGTQTEQLKKNEFIELKIPEESSPPTRQSGPTLIDKVVQTEEPSLGPDMFAIDSLVIKENPNFSYQTTNKGTSNRNIDDKVQANDSNSKNVLYQDNSDELLTKYSKVKAERSLSPPTKEKANISNEIAQPQESTTGPENLEVDFIAVANNNLSQNTDKETVVRAYNNKLQEKTGEFEMNEEQANRQLNDQEIYSIIKKSKTKTAEAKKKTQSSHKKNLEQKSLDVSAKKPNQSKAGERIFLKTFQHEQTMAVKKRNGKEIYKQNEIPDIYARSISKVNNHTLFEKTKSVEKEPSQIKNVRSLKEEYAEISESVAKLKERNDSRKILIDLKALDSIDNKLNYLIEGMKSLLIDHKMSEFYYCITEKCARKNPFFNNQRCANKINIHNPETNAHEYISNTDFKQVPFGVDLEIDSNKGIILEDKNDEQRILSSPDTTEIEKRIVHKTLEVTGTERDSTVNNEENTSDIPNKPFNIVAATEPDPLVGHNQTFTKPYMKATDLYIGECLVGKDNKNTDVNNKAVCDRITMEIKTVKKEEYGVPYGSKKYTIPQNSLDTDSKAKISNNTKQNNKNKIFFRFKPSKYDTRNNLNNQVHTDKEDKNIDGSELISSEVVGEVFNSFYRRDPNSSKIDEILIEEMDKSDQAKKDIENILKGETNKSTVDRTNLEVPTRECCTEVTASLSRTRLFDEIFLEPENTYVNTGGRMTIAVNTDPLSLLALFKISTESIRQLLSYLQQFSYATFLSSMPGSLKAEVQVVRRLEHYQCHLCGATFTKASQLGEHIRAHELATTGDCCVCRHILAVRRHHGPGLYTCKYCGQCFTRAYCRELHEQACARKLGLRPDVPENLALLK